MVDLICHRNATTVHTRKPSSKQGLSANSHPGAASGAGCRASLRFKNREPAGVQYGKSCAKSLQPHLFDSLYGPFDYPVKGIFCPNEELGGFWPDSC